MATYAEKEDKIEVDRDVGIMTFTNGLKAHPSVLWVFAFQHLFHALRNLSRAIMGACK